MAQALTVKDHVITARIGPEAAKEPTDQQGAAADDTHAPPKHIVLDAGERGRISVSACSWADAIRDRFNNGSSGGGGRKAQVVSESWVPPR